MFLDIAISAPFEGNGVVYIYLGGSKDIFTKPSQKLISPDSFPYGMFGHALSRGVDIDKNGYNDLAVGAPNSEKVYIYKTYPVIKIEYSVAASRNIFYLHDTQTNITVCIFYHRKVALEFQVGVVYKLSVDLKYRKLNRSSFDSKDSEVLTISKSTTISGTKQCYDHIIFIRPAVSNKTIIVELSYELMKKIPQNGTEFCKDCVALEFEKREPVKHEIPFAVVCDNCIADLEITVDAM